MYKYFFNFVMSNFAILFFFDPVDVSCFEKKYLRIVYLIVKMIDQVIILTHFFFFVICQADETFSAAILARN
jgi:hypothetical protein